MTRASQPSYGSPPGHGSPCFVSWWFSFFTTSIVQRESVLAKRCRCHRFTCALLGSSRSKSASSHPSLSLTIRFGGRRAGGQRRRRAEHSGAEINDRLHHACGALLASSGEPWFPGQSACAKGQGFATAHGSRRTSRYAGFMQKRFSRVWSSTCHSGSRRLSQARVGSCCAGRDGSRRLRPCVERPCSPVGRPVSNGPRCKICLRAVAACARHLQHSLTLPV